MYYWQAVLQEVLHKDEEGYQFIYTNLGDLKRQRNEQMKRRKQDVSNSSIKQVYTLGDKYKGVYLTQREAECVVQLMRGVTIAEAARVLNLSPRTVEFYLKNIKVKLKCRKKSELIECIRSSDFKWGKI